MKLVFGNAEEQDESNFKGGDGNEYYYKLTVEDEGDGNGTFKIEDSGGRFVPFDFLNLDDLVAVLTAVKEYQDDKARFNAFWQARFHQGT